MSITVADYIIRSLGAIGVTHLYGVPGDAINDLVEAIRKQDKVQFINVRHEESGAFAAACHAKLTGQLGVCVGTSGGGAIHLLNGLYDAKLDHAPVLALTGQLNRNELGNHSHQEINSVRLFDDVAQFNQAILHEDQVDVLFGQAVLNALHHRSVSHLSLPTDIASQNCNKTIFQIKHLPEKGDIHPQPELIQNAIKLINDSHSVALLIGIGAQDAVEQVLELSEQVGAPMIRSLRAKHLIPDDHERSMGGLGLLGTAASVHAMGACDLLVMIGTDFPYSEFLPKHSKVIQIDSNAAHIGRRCSVDIGIHADAVFALNQLLPQLTPKTESHFLDACLRRKASADHLSKEEKNSTLGDTNTVIKPQRLAHVIGQLATDDAIFICDTGTVTGWAARCLPIRGTQTFTLSGNLATMGFAMGGAIGAQLTYPDRQVIALIGDGGFGMMMQDFLTAVRYKLPITYIIFNNDKLGLIQLEQESTGKPNYETSLENPDFAEFALVCGGLGLSVNSDQSLSTVLTQAFESKQPTVVDVAIDPDEILMPPTIEVDQAVQFGMAKIKEAFLKFKNKLGKSETTAHQNDT